MLALGLVLLTSVGIRAPDKLTAGPADQLLGALSPDEKTLYFVSDEQSTMQLYAQEVRRGLPLVLFDEVADVSWPRPSPDGKRILYISYRTDAAGDLCVRELVPGGKAGERRCLTDATTAEIQAIWMPDGKSIAVVTRPGLNGDLELRRIPLAGGPGEVLVHGNLSSPAVSPDGRWLAYVPIERGAREVGPSFLAKAGGALVVQPLDQARTAAPATLDLPGASGFPAFSADGKWLYFTQYLNDTNFDGRIDGKDNGVLFRAPVTDGKLGSAEQLTSARWNCQYPVPAAHRLVATCAAAGSLDVYSLPLEGGVPADWTVARIDDEISASRDRWDELLLLSHRGRGDDDPQVLLRMIRLHLELGETESAAFYAQKLTRFDARAGAILTELAAHRKADRQLSRGLISADFVRDARARLERLARIDHTVALAVLARSEILDALGQDDDARAVLDGVDVSDPLAAALYADRLLALYRGEPRYFALYQPLAERDLDHAQAFVRELLQSARSGERARLTDEMAKKVDPQSELAFVLALERGLSDLTPETQEAVRQRVFDLYRKEKDYARRKVLVGITVQRAVADDNEYLLYNFADTWVSYVPRERAERRNAERVFRDAVLERAYVEAAQGKVGDARGRFFSVTLQTESLEAHAGFMEERIAENKDPAADYAAQPAAQSSPVTTRFARAYLLARALPATRDLAAHERSAQAAIAELEVIAAEAPQRAEVHALWGYIDHQRFLRSGDRIIAVEANAHGLLALDLAADRPRERATVLDLLGRLQSSVGNFAIAMHWLEERAKLPFADDRARLSHCLTLARARFHADTAASAAALSDDCILLAAGPLVRFRPLALDRSGLYHLMAGEAPVAAERYAALWKLAVPGTGAEGARNRLTTQIGWAAALLAAGQPAPALEHVGSADNLLGAGGTVPLDGPYGRLRPPAGTQAFDDGLLLDGLRAQAHFALGQLAEAATAMTRRRDGLALRLERGKLDEDRLDLASAEAQLALYAYRRKQDGDALGHLDAALRYWDAWSAATGTPIEATGLAILAGYADLHLFGGVGLARLGFDLPARLRASYTQLGRVRNPLWEPMRLRFEMYLTLMHGEKTS